MCQRKNPLLTIACLFPSIKESLANRFNRRKSVFAESYDPEGDDDEGEKVCPLFYEIYFIPNFCFLS
jgi:hypothetical protein